jgi:hypothetical protein
MKSGAMKRLKLKELEQANARLKRRSSPIRRWA